MSPLDAVEHLAGLQAQAPFPPYFGLWARLDGFRPEQLSQLILDREVVRIVLMRGTVHLVTAADALAWRPLVQSIMTRDLAGNTQHTPHLGGLDVEEVAATARKLLDERHHTNKELGAALGERWPDRATSALAHVARCLVPLIQLPPRGIWGKAGQPAYATAETWLGRPLSEPDPDSMVLRYLKAFGPASVRDAQAWTGLTRLGEVFERLRPGLKTFHDENGRELFDLPDAPRPDPETPAPTRLLGPFDQMLLSYADRTRVLDDVHRKLVVTNNGLVKGTVLLDGRVRGQWDITRRRDTATLVVTRFGKFTKKETTEVTETAADLLTFAEPDATHEIALES
jgi:winged helix DNA-binding protein